MPDVEIKEDNKNSLISLHSFTGCHYISTFFRKRKRKTTNWKTMNSKSRFKKVMGKLSEHDLVDYEISRTLGKFVCPIMMLMLDVRNISMPLDSTSLLWSRTEKNNYVGLSALVLYKATLQLHILRANRVAYLMKRSSVAQVEEPSFSDCGWVHEGRLFGLRKRILVLSRGCRLTAIMLMKVTKGTLTSILEIIVWVTNLIEIPVKFEFLNLLGPLLFVFDILGV